jgi:hypothetical protein
MTRRLTDALAYAKKLLDRLIELDKLTVGHYFEMGQIIGALEHGKLWEALGYKSIRHLIEEELSFSSGTGYRYMHCYRNSRRLGYTKTETLGLLEEFGITRTADYLAQAKAKQGIRAIRARIEELKTRHQVNFTLTNAEYAKMLRVMKKLGVEVGPSGRFVNSSEKFVEIVEIAAKEVGINGDDGPKLAVVK